MTIQQAAQTALDVQNACNGSGVVFTFAEAMHAICDEQQRLGKGTAWKNEHPIVSLFLDKLASLNHTQCLCSECLSRYHDAYAEVEKLAQPETAEPELMREIAWG